MSKVTRRLISEHDLDAVAEFLGTGFPNRSEDAWRNGIVRQRTRACPPDCPRFGAILESEGRIVGIVLSFFSERSGPRRCNFSSWYVRPGFEAYSLLLTNFMLQDRTATFFNLSPAPHTRAIIEAQGFKAYDTGWFVSVPAVRRGSPKALVEHRLDGAAGMQLTEDERVLLSDHRAMGCNCFVVESKGGSYPYVFSSRRNLGRLFATCFLVYCRDIADYEMFAGNLGRALLRHGVLSVLLDGRCKASLGPGRLISRETVKYFHGPRPPRPGDNSYSELAVFDG